MENLLLINEKHNLLISLAYEIMCFVGERASLRLLYRISRNCLSFHCPPWLYSTSTPKWIQKLILGSGVTVSTWTVWAIQTPIPLLFLADFLWFVMPIEDFSDWNCSFCSGVPTRRNQKMKMQFPRKRAVNNDEKESELDRFMGKYPLFSFVLLIFVPNTQTSTGTRLNTKKMQQNSESLCFLQKIVYFPEIENLLTVRNIAEFGTFWVGQFFCTKLSK